MGPRLSWVGFFRLDDLDHSLFSSVATRCLFPDEEFELDRFQNLDVDFHQLGKGRDRQVLEEDTVFLHHAVDTDIEEHPFFYWVVTVKSSIIESSHICVQIFSWRWRMRPSSVKENLASAQKNLELKRNTNVSPKFFMTQSMF